MTLEELEQFANVIPIPLYWLNTEGVVLGLNNAIYLKFGGPELRDRVIGKRHKDFYPDHVANILDEHNRQVIESGEPIEFKEEVVNVMTGERQYLASLRTPLRDNDGNIIGIVGTSIDITDKKEKERLMRKNKLFEELERVASLVPALLYWLDTDGVVLGLNDITCTKLGGLELRNIIVGKRHEDFYPEHVAKILNEHNRRVIESGKAMEFEEEVVNIITGEAQYYATIRTPLCDDDGNIIGVIGTSVDITGKKEKERLTRENKLLQIENETQRTLVQQQEKFRKIVGQAVHDVRSPLTSLAMMLDVGLDLPEEERITLREIATRVNDIATNLLNHFQPAHTGVTQVETCKPLLVFSALQDVLAEKRYQYTGASVDFVTDFQPGSHFTFIKAEASAFKRMLSNLINNAVDAFDNKSGVVTIGCGADDNRVTIDIRDNGKGMSQSLIDKILNNIAVSEGKEAGHGIGLAQVRETLQRHQGNLTIDSAIAKGTTIHLTFPRSRVPDWMAEQITIDSQDTVVILDDEPTIHGAWDTRFAMAAPGIALIHFKQADEALVFLSDAQNVTLLTDYELLKQAYNGLEVIEQAQVKRAILVTSHYANPRIQEQAVKLGVTILPKQLSADIPIRVVEMIN